MNQQAPVLVKFQASEHYVYIRTITHQRKSPQSFSLPRPSFTDLEADGHITIKDGYSFADFHLIDSGARVQIDFTWLSKFCDGTVKGYTQTVALDYDLLAGYMWDSLENNCGPKAWSMLSLDCSPTRPRLDFSSESAQKTIREVLAVPVLRHKLTRVIRDYFQWPYAGDHVIKFYADYDRYSFFFREYMDGREGICGGLILYHHEGLEKARYAVHT